jgi:hypothetical protein
MSFLCFLFNKIREQQDRTDSAWKGVWGKEEMVAQKMYIHMSKCKNDKLKKRKPSECKP